MIDIFVNSVYLYEDKMVIVFICKDGTKTISLAEVEAAIENSAYVIVFDPCTRCSHLDDNAPPPEVEIVYWTLFIGKSKILSLFHALK